MSTAEVQGHRVRVVPVGEESQRPEPEVLDVPLSDAVSAVRRLTSAPAFTLAWAASLPVAGGGLAWYAALHCFVC